MAIEEAKISLNILRLYLSSYYFDEHKQRIVRRMGLSGSLMLNERSRVFHINPNEPIEKQFPGGRESAIIPKNYDMNDDFVDYMVKHGLDRINHLIQSLSISREENNDIARRLLIAISWYAKATNAKSVADSFLMYAIAIEGLLSKGRTSQETYSIQMATLITRLDDDFIIYPGMGHLSIDFLNQLKESNNLTERFNIARQRILDLFSYRNRIAHGAVLDAEVEDKYLIDFETLIRNSILSFVEMEWDTLTSFINWVSENVRLEFTLGGWE